MLIIDHTNWQEHADFVQGGQLHGKGLVERNFSRLPVGCKAAAPAFPKELLVPRSEWSARIKERKERKATMRAKWEAAGVKVLNQGQTNYCWGHGPVSAIYAVRAFNMQPFIELSATSACAIITNYRNIGGMGIDAIEFIAQNGVPMTKYWPPNQINRQYDTPEMRADRSLRILTEWVDLTPRSLDEIMSCLFMDWPVAVGYNWWSHEVCAVDPEEFEPGSFGHIDVNSWGPGYGEQGFFGVQGQHAYADDAQACRVIDATPIAA